ncbi:hypothetical protein T265_15636, partial [Opisthorchis viverrini]
MDTCQYTSVIQDGLCDKFNLAFSINVFRLVLVKMKSQTSCETSRVKTLLKSICVLILIFGIYHLVFLPLDLMESQHAHYGIEQLEMIKLYCRHVMEGLQGFCAALILCFMNKEVTAELKRRYHQSRMRGAVLDTHRQSHLLEARVHLNDDGTTETVKQSITKWSRKPLSRTLRLRRHSSPFKKPSGPRKPSALCYSTIVIVENTTAKNMLNAQHNLLSEYTLPDESHRGDHQQVSSQVSIILPGDEVRYQPLHIQPQQTLEHQ